MGHPAPDNDALVRIEEDSLRGFLGTRSDPAITDGTGRLVFDLGADGFLGAPAPGTADPVLWDHSRRTARHGLFEVAPGILQVRGFDLANLTIVEGEHGIIVIDTLTCVETAEAALDLYAELRGRRPVTGIILTHPHADHFGGSEAVLARAVPGAPVLAPEGFHAHALRENVIAGPAMHRRSTYMYGTALVPGPEGHIGCGLGPRLATGTATLIRPTDSITGTGQTRTIDGIEFEFQLTPGTEAPAEMNIFLPRLGALCLAENAVHTLHNIITLRGAQVRDAKRWSGYLDETLRLFGPRTDVAFATHHWPTWGRDRVSDFLAVQRDVYGFLHDQTVRLMNDGLTADEIAERLVLPDALATSPVIRGFYGSLSHNVKGIVQFYLGWYDGNPSHLWPLPKSDSAGRWIGLLGGVDAAITHVRGLLADSSIADLRFAAEVLDACIFTDPTNAAARSLLAEVHTRLAHGCENAVWRNEFLSAAAELRAVPAPVTAASGRSGGNRIAQGLGIADVLDAMSVRVDGLAAAEAHLRIDLIETDEADERVAIHRAELHNGVLHHHIVPAERGAVSDGAADLTIDVPPGTAARLAARGPHGFTLTGDAEVWDRLSACLTSARRGFPIIEPR